MGVVSDFDELCCGRARKGARRVNNMIVKALATMIPYSLQQAELVRQEDEDEGEDEEGRQPWVFAHRTLAVFAHKSLSVKPSVSRGGSMRTKEGFQACPNPRQQGPPASPKRRAASPSRSYAR